MYETTYHRPANLDEALSLLGSADDGRFLAGGQTLIPVLKQRLDAPSDLIDIGGLDELRGIEAGDGAVTIGAATPHAEVATSEAVRQAIPALAGLAGMIGDPAVRHRGTIGGSLANNDPAADYPAALLALGATVHTNRRALAAEDFLDGLFATALEEGEIIVKVSFPVPSAASYRKFRNPASRYAMAGAFVAVMADGSVRVGITGAGAEGAFRPAEIEAALATHHSPSALDGITLDEDKMLGDIHGSQAYRANLAVVMTRRAVADLA